MNFDIGNSTQRKKCLVKNVWLKIHCRKVNVKTTLLSKLAANEANACLIRVQ